MCPHLKERAVSLLKQEMLKRQKVDQQTRPLAGDTGATSVLSSSKTTCILSSSSIAISDPVSARRNLLMEIFDKPSAALEKSDMDLELEKYLSSTSLVADDKEDDVLSYWREYQTIFPTIASIARDVLAIPASNTSVERLFSSCKNTVTDKRTKLGAEKLNKLMFLKHNMHLAKEESHLDSTETSLGQTLKRKYDAAISDDHSMVRKRIQSDECMPVDDNEHLINIESEDDEDIV